MATPYLCNIFHGDNVHSSSLVTRCQTTCPAWKTCVLLIAI